MHWQQKPATLLVQTQRKCLMHSVGFFNTMSGNVTWFTLLKTNMIYSNLLGCDAQSLGKEGAPNISKDPLYQDC